MTNAGCRLPFPRVVRIEPSSICNLRCSHCPTGTFEMTRGIMTADIFSRVLQSLKSNKDKVKIVVLYHGGEPFLNKKLLHMVKEIKACGEFFVKTVSNGMALNDSIIAAIIESGLDSIEFSLDGESPEQNDFIRRNCNFDRVFNNVTLLIKEKKKHGFKSPQIFIATTQFLNQEDVKNNNIEVAAPHYLLELFNEYRQDIAGFKPTLAMRWPDMGPLEDYYEIYTNNNNTESNNYCDHLINTITIRWNGDVVPCCYDLTSKNIMGNICESELEDIWNNNKYISLRRSIAQRQFIAPCNNCNIVKPETYLVRKLS